EIWFNRKNGNTFPVLLSSTVLHDIEGRLIGSSTIMRDITEIYDARKKLEEDEKQIRKQQEELNKLSELRLKTELKYRNLYDNSPELYRSANADGVIIDCNRSYAEHLGYTREEIIGKSVYDNIAENSLNDFRGLVEKWKKEGRVTNEEIWFKRKNGNTFPVLLSSTGLHDIEGRLIGSNTVIKDITEIYDARKKLEQSEALVRKQFEDLKDIDVLKSKFATMITHELKTPFVPVKGYCEMLKESGLLGTLNQAQAEVVDGIYRNCIRLETLISDMLDAQLLDMKQIKFVKENFVVDQFLANIMNDFSPMMKEKQIKFVNSTKGTFSMTSDKNRLYQIFRNLISNAVDFVSKVGRIEIGAKDDGNKITFYVKDNGMGIPEEKQDRLFQKFYQIDTVAKRKHGGTGLGLSVCKGIAEGLGGKIWCESKVGQGASFYFTIPKV
ncbi:MAG: ATP-binding protein, partial [Nitrososphaerota archaeon]